MKQVSENTYTIDSIDLPEIFNHRKPETTKKDYGHALLIAGSLGKMGAAVLAAKACMHSGVGLLTVHAPACGMEILQTAVPEAMVSIDKEDFYCASLPEHLERYNAIAVGPGLGTQKATRKMLKNLLKQIKNMGEKRPRLVIDADALNIIAANSRTFMPLLPTAAILTPHEGEYRRLFGNGDALEMAKKYQITLVQKAHQTHTASHKGQLFINQTGNAGMATAGSGDVMTGIILALAAQGFTSAVSAMMGVYLHGLAADMAVKNQSQASLTASDIINYLKIATY
ncbi:MAG: NAD(P)H-hydrate dehydratase [Bacteroidales bacterium]|nr:NAD(P)H-hydrate dehydratase [Bacteroidales bacterium]